MLVRILSMKVITLVKWVQNYSYRHEALDAYRILQTPLDFNLLILIGFYDILELLRIPENGGWWS